MTIDNHPLTPKPVDDRKAGDGYHQVLPVDREAVADYLSDPLIRAGRFDHHPLVQAFTRHREQAERPYKEAIKLIRMEAEREN